VVVNSEHLFDSFNALRAGDFERALEASDRVLIDDPENFWGWFFGAVSLGYLERRDAFSHYLTKLENLNSNSPFLSYLKAYRFLWDHNIESALLEWTRILNYEEGWLAGELIQRCRKGERALIKKAEKGDISSFIVLPDFLNDLKKNIEESSPFKGVVEPPKLEMPRVEEKIPAPVVEPSVGRFREMIPVVAGLGVALAVFVVAVTYIPTWLSGQADGGEQSREWEHYSIQDGAFLRTENLKDTNMYLYKDKDQLIEDFEMAKKELGNHKINRARFILQRIIHSNADFQTKEKSKIFLNFIPQPDYQDFDDPVFPAQIISAPDYYSNVVVLWQGTVLKSREVEKGVETRLLVREGEQDYIVETFLPREKSTSDWLSFSDFKNPKNENSGKKSAVVYGIYRGLLGDQKVIYLELKKLWM